MEYGVVWTVVFWYVVCYIMQDVESYVCEMWWCEIVVVKNVAYAVGCAIVHQMWKIMQCVAMSDVVV